MSFFSPNTDFISDFNNKGKFLLVWRLSIILSGLFAIASILTFFSDLYSCFLYLISFFVCLFCFIYLKITKNTRHIFWIFTISASLIVTFSLNTLLSTLHYPDFIWAICTIVFAYIGLGKKYGIYFLIFHVLSMISFFVFGINEHIIRLTPLGTNLQISVLFEMITAFFALTYLIIQYLHFQTYTEKVLLETNIELSKKNKEITILMKEIHHRIKNNLQLVISLLRMQRAEIDSKDVQYYFTEAINRVMSISIIHQKLYQREDIKNFDFEDYIDDLIQEVKSFQEYNFNVEFEVSIHVKDIGLKTLVPLGLLLNELLTNSYKHAFTEGTQNKVLISINQLTRDKINLLYKDSGTWKESATKGFGLELVDLLTSQLEGNQEKTGNQFEFSLRNLDLE